MQPREPLTKRRRWYGAKLTVERTGEVRGRLTFLSWAGTGTISKRSYWHVQCECGERRIVRGDTMARSCGCLNEEALKDPTRFLKADGTYHNQVTVIVDGHPMGLRAAARWHGLSERTVLYRRNKLKWPLERLFDPPRLPYAKLKAFRRRQKRRKK